MLDVLTIGSATRDAFFKGINFLIVEDDRLITKKGICLPLGAKITVPSVYFMTGGGATNTAVVFKKMGLKTGAIFRVGKDVSGETIKREMIKEGIELNLVQEDRNKPTAYSVILLTDFGERTILNYKGANEFFSSKEIPVKKINARWLFLGSLGKNPKNLEFLLELKKRQGIRMAINPGKYELSFLKNYPQFLSLFDIFICNQEEASYLSDVDYLKEGLIFQKLDSLIKGIVVMTKGKKGVSVSDGQYLYSARIVNYRKFIKKPLKVEKDLKQPDATGAGDAFAATFTSFLIKKNVINEKNIEEAIRLALINSSSVVNFLGAKTGILDWKNIQKNKLNQIKIKKIKL